MEAQKNRQRRAGEASSTARERERDRERERERDRDRSNTSEAALPALMETSLVEATSTWNDRGMGGRQFVSSPSLAPFAILMTTLSHFKSILSIPPPTRLLLHHCRCSSSHCTSPFLGLSRLYPSVLLEITHPSSSRCVPASAVWTDTIPPNLSALALCSYCLWWIEDCEAVGLWDICEQDMLYTWRLAEINLSLTGVGFTPFAS